MKHFNKITTIFLLITINLFANSCIDGYELKDSAMGVELCVNGETSVQVLDLTKGATVKFLTTDTKKENGAVSFKMQTMDSFWNNFKKDEKEYAFSIINAGFYDGKSVEYEVNKYTKLTHRFIVNNNIYTEGYQNEYWDNEKNLEVKYLIIRNNKAFVEDVDFDDQEIRKLKNDGKQALAEEKLLTKLAIGKLHYPISLIAGYSIATAEKDPIDRILSRGRTIIATNTFGTKLYLLVDESASLDDARRSIKSFDPNIMEKNIIILDSGGSSQLRSSSSYDIIGSDGPTGRALPQTIGVLSGVYNDIFSLSIEETKAVKYLTNTIPLFNRNNGAFGVGTSISRAELSKVIIKALQFMNRELVEGDLSGYIDVDDVTYFRKYAIYLHGMGLLKGENGRLRPKDPISYKELAKVIGVAFLGKDFKNPTFKDIKDSEELYGEADWSIKYFECFRNYGSGYKNRFNETVNIFENNKNNYDSKIKRGLAPMREDVALFLYRAYILWQDGKFDKTTTDCIN